MGIVDLRRPVPIVHHQHRVALRLRMVLLHRMVQEGGVRMAEVEARTVAAAVHMVAGDLTAVAN